MSDCTHCNSNLEDATAAQHQAMMRTFMAAPETAHVGARADKTIDPSMTLGLWMTLASLGATFLVSAILMLGLFIR